MGSTLHLQATLALLLLLLFSGVQGRPGPMPQAAKKESPAEKANKVPQGVTPAKNGSVILDTTEMIKLVTFSEKTAFRFECLH